MSTKKLEAPAIKACQTPEDGIPFLPSSTDFLGPLNFAGHGRIAVIHFYPLRRTITFGFKTGTMLLSEFGGLEVEFTRI